jgi:predicted HTH domain antitoxin
VTPEEFARALRLAAALFWYGRSEITLGTAAALAGLSQAEFMRALKQAKQATVVVDLDDLDQELTFLAQRRAQTRPGG